MLRASFPGEPGSYLLGLRLTVSRQLTIGAIGTITFPAGLYVYTGSAMGPGGVRARLGRHWWGGTRQRWHIDYLRPQAGVVFATYLTGPVRAECRWAGLLAGFGGTAVAAGFGASDCRCPAHLFHLEDDVAALRRALMAAEPGLGAWVEAGDEDARPGA